MACHAGIKIALAGGAVMVALAAGAIGGAGISNATTTFGPVAPPAPGVVPPSPPRAAPEAPAPSANTKAPAGRRYYLVPSEIRD